MAPFLPCWETQGVWSIWVTASDTNPISSLQAAQTSAWSSWTQQMQPAQTTLTQTTLTISVETVPQYWQLQAAPAYWESWAADPKHQMVSFKGWNAWVKRSYLTGKQREEQRRADEERKRRDEELVARYHEMMRKREEAEQRAKGLLRNILGDTDYEALQSAAGLIVVGASGRRYRISGQHSTANIELLDEHGASAARLCAHPGDALPLSDHLLAQVLHLQADDEGFVSVANLHGGALPDELAARRVERRAARIPLAG